MRSPRHACRLVVLVGLGAGVLVLPALAKDCPEVVGHLPGPVVGGFAVSGNHAYLGSLTGLTIVDVSDPSAPLLVGEASLPGGANGVAVSGDYAYVTGPSGFSVIDVSTPWTPGVVGFLDEVAGGAIAVSGGYAYVAIRWTGLFVIDVNTPSAPVVVGFLFGGWTAESVAVSGDYAYVVSIGMEFFSWLSVVDVSTPSAPVAVGYVDIGHGKTGEVEVSGNYAYVIDTYGDLSLQVIDVSTPSAPVVVGLLFVGGPAGDFAVSGGYAFVAGNGLNVIDVSTPTNPVVVAYLAGVAGDVAVSGGYAYVAGSVLNVIDVSDPLVPILTGDLRTLSAEDVAVSGGYAYVAGSVFHAVDVSDSSAPMEVGFLNMPDDGHGVAVAGGYAYVAWGYPVDRLGGLRVIDKSTPSAPFWVGEIIFWDGGAFDVAVSGGYAYVASGYWDWDGSFGELRVIDVSSPSAPAQVGFVDTQNLAQAVTVSGGYAYVAAGDAGLLVIDVSAPSAPVKVGLIDTGGARDVAVSGDYAYVAGNVFSVVDVSVPSAPVEVGTLDTEGDAVAVTGHYAYVASRGGLQVVDVSTPFTPVEVGFFATGGASGVALSGGLAYLAAADAGLYIFNQCTGPGLDARECFIPAAAVAAGAQGAFFHTDVEVNNTGTEEAEVSFQWLPRGEDIIEPIQSDPVVLAAGQSRRFDNILAAVFGLASDAVGAIRLVASTDSVIGMSRTYNIPAGKAAGTFGQGLPAVRTTEMIMGTEPRRIIFLSENDDARANVGCVNGSSEPVRINIGIFDDDGTLLETKTMDLGPFSNNQINRIFKDYSPINGYIEVWAYRDEALYYCYGSMLDNETSDPTTILPQVPSSEMTFIPAAALAAGVEGAFFETDVDLNNVGSTDLTYELLWLPRGEDNSVPVRSELFSLAPGAGVRYANVLDEVFGLEPDQVGALAVEASGTDLLAMSRTYNIPSAKVVGTFGQELPGIPVDRMVPTGEKKRIIFLSENDDVRSNVGCQNGSRETLRVFIELFNSEGESLATTNMILPPYSNRQINRIFQDYAPVNGYVDVRTYTPDALIYCYGSVLDNVTSDPTTVLPQ